MKFRKFEKISIWKIPKICNLAKLKKKSIWKFFKIVDSENSKNFQFRKFQKFPKYINFEKLQIFLIVQLRKINFKNTTIQKIININEFTILQIIIYFEYSNNLNQYQNKKINSKIKKSNNSSFVLLILISFFQFRNIDLQHSVVPNFDPHPFEMVNFLS